MNVPTVTVTDAKLRAVEESVETHLAGVHILLASLEQLIAERDRARDIAVALEQENAHLEQENAHQAHVIRDAHEALHNQEPGKATFILAKAIYVDGVA